MAHEQGAVAAGAPVAGEDGFSGQHGSNGEGVRQAVQFGGCNERARHAGLHRERCHVPAQHRDVPIHVNSTQDVQLPQRILQSRPLHRTMRASWHAERHLLTQRRVAL